MLARNRNRNRNRNCAIMQFMLESIFKVSFGIKNIFVCVQDDDEPVWVDTVGWDDAECEDDETFKDILRFIDKYNITKVFSFSIYYRNTFID